MSSADIVRDLLSSVPKAVAAGVVDMRTGELLDVHTTANHPQQVLDMVALATHDLFEGPNVSSIENTFKQIRGDDYQGRYFREIIVTSKNLLHIFARLHQDENLVAVVVAKEDTNLGLALVNTRAVVREATI